VGSRRSKFLIRRCCARSRTVALACSVPNVRTGVNPSDVLSSFYSVMCTSAYIPIEHLASMTTVISISQYNPFSSVLKVRYFDVTKTMPRAITHYCIRVIDELRKSHLIGVLSKRIACGVTTKNGSQKLQKICIGCTHSTLEHLNCRTRANSMHRRLRMPGQH
jgi:hypothetical protein